MEFIHWQGIVAVPEIPSRLTVIKIRILPSALKPENGAYNQKELTKTKFLCEISGHLPQFKTWPSHSKYEDTGNEPPAQFETQITSLSSMSTCRKTARSVRKRVKWQPQDIHRSHSLYMKNKVTSWWRDRENETSVFWHIAN